MKQQLKKWNKRHLVKYIWEEKKFDVDTEVPETAP